MFLLLAMAMVKTDLKEMATMATMLAKADSSSCICRFGRVEFLRTTLRVAVVVSESLVTRKHVRVTLARVVH